MTIEQLLRQIEATSSSAHVRAVFGEPVSVGERTLIPVARVRGMAGMGFGEGKEEEGEERESGQGAGGGGLFSARPVAVVELTSDRVRVIPVVDLTRIVLLSMVVSAWSIFWCARTMRAGRSGLAVV